MAYCRRAINKNTMITFKKGSSCLIPINQTNLKNYLEYETDGSNKDDLFKGSQTYHKVATLSGRNTGRLNRSNIVVIDRCVSLYGSLSLEDKREERRGLCMIKELK